MTSKRLLLTSITERSQHRGRLSAKGFTLVEVMVAMLIVAVAISSLLFQMMSTIDNTAYLRDKTIAHWVALNQQELLFLENEHTNRILRTERSGKEEMAGREWFWRAKPLEIVTENNNFQQIEITVREKEEDTSNVVSLRIVLDQYHRLGGN
ncbi:type II secretion system minor pseudopilin GspI [Oceanicoccus sp. KOV_DT_Chl]|uniref:type II secretion system minor pseudopilin GspI n=1 Tax=Oceanicoccus sp. KOV_DT_Chl TaxID=1904639 RepID=UPI000C79FDC5|nr:type II secretion system minor pseudopilin GspI [Oceanicoccus sp. KOV_DT_Chl]